MSDGIPSEGSFAELSGRERTLRASALSRLLQTAVRLQAWCDEPLPEGLKTHLQADRQRVALEVLELLVGWEQLGGGVELADAKLGGQSAALKPPATTVVLRSSALRSERAIEVRDFPAVQSAPGASDDQVRGLARHFESGGAMRQEPVAPNWEEVLAKVAAGLGPLLDDGDAEVGALHAVIREADRWRGLPREVQRSLVGLVTARLRRAQDEMGVSGPRLDEGFSMLSAWSKREQPGWVNGLSRGHRPTRGSWSADAEAYSARLPQPEPPPAVKENQEKLLAAVSAFVPEFEGAPVEALDAVRSQFRVIVRKALNNGVRPSDPRLVKLVVGQADLFEGKEFGSLRKAIREELEPPDNEEEDAKVLLPPDWAWWGRTRYRRAIMVGGDPREPNRERLERVFGLSELEWMSTEFKQKNLEKVRDRVRAGKVDLVLILGSFVGHDADQIIIPACREMGVDWVHVDRGYGPVRVRRAIERFLDPLASR